MSKPLPAKMQVTPMEIQPLPAGTYCLLEHVSMTTDSGITGIPAGTRVRRLKDKGSTVQVTDGTSVFDVKLSQLTNDPAVAARIGRDEAQKNASMAAWQQSQQQAVRDREDANLAAIVRVATAGDLRARYGTGNQWQTDYQLAMQQAAAEHKKVLLDFTGSDWCQWCMKTEKDVFSKPEFMDYAVKNLVLVKLDYPINKILPSETKAQNIRLAAQFNITGYPTIVLMDSGGAELLRFCGYYQGGPRVYITMFDSLKKP